jgi:two-component system nitrate/nitrite response regulator NarL
MKPWSQGPRLQAVPGPSRVLIVDEYLMFRQALRVAFESADDLDIVAEGDDYPSAIELSATLEPDVVVLSASMSRRPLAKFILEILDRRPETKVLVLSTTLDDEMLVESVEAGATAFLTTDAPLSELVDSIRRIVRGEVLIPRGMLGQLLKSLIRRKRQMNDDSLRHARLTKREREVLELLATGATNEVIAERLVISPQTARTHVQSILSKLDVHSRLEAASFALRLGLAPSTAGIA